jgi:hypothetical protein
MEINKNKVKKILTTTLTNNQIVEIYLKNKLIQTCCECQFAKRKDLLKYYDDFYQDLILVLLLYDNEKMNDAHINNHFNALLTRIIQNNLNSTTSEFYRKYLRYDNNKEELTNKHKEITNNEEG